MNGTLETSVFITIIILSLGMVGPLLAAMYFMDDIAKVSSIMNDIGSVLDEPEQFRPKVPATLYGRDISLEKVSFSYGKKEVLHDINLKIPARSVTAFVGPSGSGKSTIAKLIASLWDANSGCITIGDTDVKNIPQTQLMNLIAYVSQDNYLFNESIMDNIRMGNQEATDGEVIAAAKSSGCHDFIVHLENGYQTIAGDAGNHLSGGERQRVAIARAMLKKADIVILDEATAYTDPENESTIQRAVAKFIENKTLIVIAHRLSTITDSDQIIVVESGNIIAHGRHEQLLESCPLYKKMWMAHINAKDVA